LSPNPADEWTGSNEPAVWKELLLGTGDGTTKHFANYGTWRPIEVGSIKLYVIPASLLYKLLPVEDYPPLKVAINSEKTTEGANTLQVDYLTGYLTANLAEPMKAKEELYIRFLWRPPRLRDHKIRVRGPDGKKEWVSLAEFFDVQRGR
jgi:hypothetical protein